MSESEQDLHLGRLLVEERKLSRKLACLASKLRRISNALRAADLSTDGHPGAPAFEECRRGFLDEGGADIVRYLDQYRQAVLELAETRREIKAIDGQELPARSS